MFLKQPAWVLADEATSALDEQAENTLYERLTAMVRRKGGAMVSIAHRPALDAFHRRRWELHRLPDGQRGRLPAARRPDLGASRAPRPRASRRAIQRVEAQITTPPISVERLGVSANTSQPSSDAQTRSRNLTDWVAEMSATANERARQ